MGIMSFLKRKVEGIQNILVLGSGRNVLFSSSELFNSALWSCVVNLSRLYATLPWHAYSEDRKGGKHKESGTLLSELLKKPNPFMTDYEFRFVMGYNFEMHGEAPAIIQRSSTGRPIALYPVSPHSLVASWVDGRLYYTLALDGKRYSASDVLLIRNTPTGYGAGNVLDPIYYAASDLDLEEHCKQLQKEYYNGASVVGNIISVPSRTPDDQKDKIRQQFNSAKGFRNYIVDENIKITPIQIQNADISKLSEAQKWNAAEVARRFNIPPFLIGDTTGTYNNSEQQGLHMVIYCLQPRVTAWETALNAALCDKNQYVKFALEGLMRGDHATRSAYYHNAIMDGWMDINEVRAKEELPGIGPDGDIHFFPMNYGSLADVAAGKYASSGMGGLGGIWNEPVGKNEAHKKLTLREEKRAHDLRYVAEAQAPAKSNRAKIEALIRKQLKKSIEQLKTLIATGSPTDQVLSDFKSWLDTYAAELQPQYKAIYLDILQKMVPVVKDETGKDDEIPDDKLDSYASSYADGVVGRVSGTLQSTAKNSMDTDHFDDDMDSLEQDYPIDQSEEEVNRSSNAFAVFLFSQLHLSVFHVVAASNSCEFCDALDGKVSSVEGYVLKKGSDVDTGNGGVRHINKDYRHPPFHAHCRCSVAPGE